MLDLIGPGDLVIIRTPQGQERSGRAVMRGPAGWVLNMGGKHGTPGIASEANIVRVTKRGGKKTHRTAERAAEASYLEAMGA